MSRAGKIFIILLALALFWPFLSVKAQTFCCTCKITNNNKTYCAIGDYNVCGDIWNSPGVTSNFTADQLKVAKQSVSCEASSSKPNEGACRGLPDGLCYGAPMSTVQFLAAVKTEIIRNIGETDTTPATTVSSAKPVSSTIPKLSVEIPGLTFSPIKQEAGKISVPWLAEYINAVYKYMVSIVLIVATVMVTYGGFRYLIGSSMGDVKRGKEIMTDAVIGMVVVLCAYLILKTINPYTTQMVTLTINTAVIPPVTDTQGDVASISGATCVDENSLTSISGIPNITASSGDNRLEKTTAQALTSAGQFALQTMDPETKQSFSGLKVYSAVRTQAKQQQLWDAHRAANPNETEEQAKKTVAKPSDCSTPTPHMTGRAVDIHLMLGGSELVGKDMTQARIDALQAIMTKAGWYRYCAEWWHFEFGLSHDSTRSQNCGTYTR